LAKASEHPFVHLDSVINGIEVSNVKNKGREMKEVNLGWCSIEKSL